MTGVNCAKTGLGSRKAGKVPYACSGECLPAEAGGRKLPDGAPGSTKKRLPDIEHGPAVIGN